MDLSQDWLDFIDSLLENHVEFLIVGAFAMGFHRLPRTTGDIDFWVRPSRANSRRVFKAITDFGLSDIGLKEDDFASPNRVLFLGVPPNRIDVMTSIDGVHFDEAWSQREFGTIQKRELPFISREHLLQNKLATGRDKDLVDAKRLRTTRPRGRKK